MGTGVKFLVGMEMDRGERAGGTRPPLGHGWWGKGAGEDDGGPEKVQHGATDTAGGLCLLTGPRFPSSRSTHVLIPHPEQLSEAQAQLWRRLGVDGCHALSGVVRPDRTTGEWGVQLKVYYAGGMWTLQSAWSQSWGALRAPGSRRRESRNCPSQKAVWTL